jgi:hypothetical protein
MNCETLIICKGIKIQARDQSKAEFNINTLENKIVLHAIIQE